MGKYLQGKTRFAYLAWPVVGLLDTLEPSINDVCFLYYPSHKTNTLFITLFHEGIVFCYQNCSKKAWKSVRKNDTSVNKKFFQLNQGWKRTSRKRFLRPRPFLRSRPKAETEKWRPRPRNVSEMSFFNRGLIENIFYSHESFFITLFQAFLEQFW